MANKGNGSDALEERLRCVYAALKLKQPSAEAKAAMKRIAAAELAAYEAAFAGDRSEP